MSEAPPRNAHLAVEPSDASPRLVAAMAAGLAVVVVLSALAIGLAFPGARHGPSDAPRIETARPRLQIDPAADLAAFRAREERELTTPGWIDRARGIARIPIAQAMRDVAAAGIPDWPTDAR